MIKNHRDCNIKFQVQVTTYFLFSRMSAHKKSDSLNSSFNYFSNNVKQHKKSPEESTPGLV